MGGLQQQISPLTVTTTTTTTWRMEVSLGCLGWVVVGRGEQPFWDPTAEPHPPQAVRIGEGGGGGEPGRRKRKKLFFLLLFFLPSRQVNHTAPPLLLVTIGMPETITGAWEGTFLLPASASQV